jgi:hypothetical protein
MNFNEVRTGGCETYLLSDPITIPHYATVYVCIRIQECEKFDKEWAETGSHWVGIEIVSPEKAPPQSLEDIQQEYGLTPDDAQKIDHAILAEGLVQSGTSATVWEQHSNDEDGMIARAKEFAATIPSNFGDCMGTQQNAMRALGWDVIMGELSPQSDEERGKVTA